MPLEITITVECITNWITSKSLELKGKYVLYEKKYWYLDQYMCVSVRRNRMWFQEAIEKMDDVWKTIEKERLEGYQHRAPKKRIKQNTTSAPVVIKLDTEPVCNIVLDEVI
jgi:pyruvate/2-oxoacid:ferredoxin oxidoreductase beta subunit